jgi:hypothetical protein
VVQPGLADAAVPGPRIVRTGRAADVIRITIVFDYAAPSRVTEAIASFFQREEFRVPPVVTSFSPARGAPLQDAV